MKKCMKKSIGLLPRIKYYCKEFKFNWKDLHEFIILGGSDPGVGVNDCSLAYCLTPDILFTVLIPEGAIDLESPSCG